MSSGSDPPRVLIIGVGNRYRSDDAVGVHAARRLRAVAPRDVAVVEHDGEPTDLLLAWQDADYVVLIDAISADDPPGTILRFEVGVDLIPPDVDHASTHLLGPGAAIALARALDRLPSRLVVYGVVGRDFGWGEKLSTDVSVALEDLVDRVLAEVR